MASFAAVVNGYPRCSPGKVLCFCWLRVASMLAYALLRRHGAGDRRGDGALPAVRGQGRGGRPSPFAGAPGVTRALLKTFLTNCTLMLPLTVRSKVHTPFTVWKSSNTDQSPNLASSQPVIPLPAHTSLRDMHRHRHHPAQWPAVPWHRPLRALAQYLPCAALCRHQTRSRGCRRASTSAAPAACQQAAASSARRVPRRRAT